MATRQELVDYLAAGHTRKQTADHFRISINTVKSQIQADKQVNQKATKSMYTNTPDEEVVSRSIESDGSLVAKSYGKKIKTVEDLLDYIEADLYNFEVEKCEATCNEVVIKDQNGTPVVTQYHRVFARLKPKARIDQFYADLKNELVADIRNAVKGEIILPPASKANKKTGHMLEVSPFDLHIGKLAWGEETGEDFDCAIAESLFVNAVEDLIRKSSGFDIDSIVLPVGNDLLQIDNLLSQTTAGTPQDTDSRYRKMFRTAVSLMSWAAQRLAEIAPVTIVIVPGNHDTLAAYHVGEVLSARFAGHKWITVDNGAKMRKYVEYGINLIGFTHGNEEKHADLPLIMANEMKAAWSNTIHHEWHVGHLHKAKETRYTAGDSFNGVRVRILPSLSGTDAWHYKKGYVGEVKACEAYLWSRTEGYVGHLSSSGKTDTKKAKAA